MKIATWNIYWLGDRNQEHIARTQQDEQLIAEVIDKLSPDVLALQEIVDPVAMDRILNLASGDLTIRSDDGSYLTSDSDPLNEENLLQKVFLCINRETIEIVRVAPIRGGSGGRKPFAGTLRHKASGKEFVTVVVHFRSGYPVFLDEEDAAARQKETSALARWLRGEAISQNPMFPEPELDDIVVMGDYNAELNDPNRSLDPLREGVLSNWMWNNPVPDGERWETALYEGDRYVIDFMMLSPAMKPKLTLPPTIYAWDYDAELGGPTRFHEGPGGSGNLKGYGVSDHRPVFVVIDF